MKDYIEKALRTESPIGMELLGRLSEHARATHAAFGLQTEIGEYIDGNLKRPIFYNKQPDKVNAAEEIGDMLWYIAILCDVHGITIEQCMEANIKKLAARYPDKFNEQDAVNRDLEGEQRILADSLLPSEVPLSLTAEHDEEAASGLWAPGQE